MVGQIWDWKRSKAIRETSFDGTFGVWPCDLLPDCNLSHYYMQLNVYRWLLENNSEYKVERMCSCVFHPNKKSYVTYEVPNLQHLVQRVMIQRLRHNRDKVFTSNSEEDVRYRAVINEFFLTAAHDVTDMWSM